MSSVKTPASTLGNQQTLEKSGPVSITHATPEAPESGSPKSSTPTSETPAALGDLKAPQISRESSITEAGSGIQDMPQSPEPRSNTKDVHDDQEDVASEKSAASPRSHTLTVESSPTPPTDASAGDAPCSSLNTCKKRSRDDPEDAPEPKKQKMATQELLPVPNPVHIDTIGNNVTNGIRNPDTLCYRIAALVLLFHNPRVLKYLELNKWCYNGTDCIICLLYHLSRAYWCFSYATPGSFMNLDRLFRLLGWGGDATGDNEQADTNEQLNWILEQIGRVNNGKHAKFEPLGRLFTRNECSNMKCSGCGHVSSSDREERTLTIDINPKPAGVSPRGPTDLSQYLDRPFNECISDHRCDHCQQKSDKIREHRITKLSETLTVVFNRVTYNRRGQPKKDHSAITFPETLDLAPYLSANMDPQTNAKYKLCGVVLHNGSLNAGHYVTRVKQPYTGAWSLVDDLKVTPISAEDALAPKMSAKSAYMLSYRRVDTGKMDPLNEFNR